MRRSEATRNVTLFPYQKDCIEIIKRASISKERILLSIAIGFGRSMIIVQVLKELLETRKIRRALLVVPRRVLLNTFSDMLLKHSLENIKRISISREHSRRYLEQKFKDVSILLSSLDMFRREVSRFPSDFFDIVFLDECHILSEKDWKIVRASESTIVGLTSNNPFLISQELLSSLGLQRPTYSYGISSVKLKDLADVFLGANYTSVDLSEEGPWKFIRPRDVKNNRIFKVRTFASERVAKRNPRSVLVAGDILLQNIFDFSRMAIVKKKDLPAIASKNFFIIRSNTVSSDFLFDYLQSKTIRIAFRKQLEELAHGVIKHVNLADIREMPIPFPFSEKHLDRFVKMRRYNKFNDLKKARDEIKQLRRAYQKYSKLGD